MPYRTILRSVASVLMVLALSLGAVTGTPVLAAPGATYYVCANTGDDGNVGSEGSPWLTIHHAVGEVGPGDTIIVAGGSYSEDPNVDVEGLTLQGPYAGTPGYDPTRNLDEAVIHGTVTIEADGVTFRGFVVQGGPVGIALGGASECTIENNIIRDNVVGILLLGGTLREGTEQAELTTDRNTIRGNRIYENADGEGSGGGIVLINCSYTMIEHNHIHDNDGVGIGMTGGKFGWDSQEEEWMFEGESLHNQVLGNEVHGHMYGDDDEPWPAFGVFILNASGTLVAGNSICENFLGIMVLGLSGSGDSDHEGGATDNGILSNDICDNEEGGIAVLLDSGTLSILKNSILRNGDHGVMVGYVDDGGTVAIHYNCITDHREYGVSLDDNGGYQPVDANLNWWGDTSGPTHSANPGGTGDAVSDNVDFDPWLIGLAYTGGIAFTGADNVVLQATLSSSDNGAQGAMVDFYVDGNHAGSADTDLSGVAELNIGTLAAGDYEVTAKAAGCFEATAELEVQAAPAPQPPAAGAVYPVWVVLLAGLVAGGLLMLRRRWAQI